jgi:anti-anti-sigma factor
VTRSRSAAATAPAEHGSAAQAHDAEVLRRLVTSCVAVGLRSGHRVVYVGGTTRAPAVLGWLRHAGLDPGPALTTGHLELRAAAAHTAALCSAPTAGDLATDVVTVHHHDRTDIASRGVAGPGPVHGVVVQVETPGGSGMRISRVDGEPRLRVAGEVDLTTYPLLAAALTASVHPGRDLHLDLAETTFLDVAAIRLLARTAEGLGPGRRLLLWSPPPMVAPVLRASGWDRLPGLLVADPAPARATP